MLQKKIQIDRLHIDTTSNAYLEWNHNTSETQFLERIAKTPQAIWITNTGAIPLVSRQLSEALDANEVVILVLYNIPKRDASGQFSAGGARDRNDYIAYVDHICQIVDDHQAIVIIEPDAVPDMVMGSLSEHDKTLRSDLIDYAIGKLTRLENTDVYLDCGHSEWPEEGKLVTWLKETKVLERVTGIALNVSNFKTTEACLQRARGILGTSNSEKLPAIIDCSRNGGVSEKEDPWCNPLSARLGDEPTLNVDGFHGKLWIKRPGESDGLTNSKVAAGDFDIALARRLCGLS